MQRLLLLGLNHTTAPLEVRERLAFNPQQRFQTPSQLLETVRAARRDLERGGKPGAALRRFSRVVTPGTSRAAREAAGSRVVGDVAGSRAAATWRSGKRC